MIRFPHIHSTVIWLVSYFSLIPVFSIVYIYLPTDSFYAPYIRYERTAREEGNEVAAALQSAVQLQAGQADHGSGISVDGWDLHTTQLDILEINFLDVDRITFGLACPINKGSEARKVILNLSMDISNGAVVPLVSGDRVAEFGRPVALLTESESSPFLRALFQLIFSPRSGEAFGVLYFSPQANLEVSKFAEWMHAGPLSVGGSWLRMLYFSAIVATTVGFGDIVPLTTEARILTALEAVLGVLFAGLFLNSIVRRP
jgi:ion channel